MEGTVVLTDAMRRVKNIFWIERKVNRALSSVSGAGNKPLEEDTAAGKSFRCKVAQST